MSACNITSASRKVATVLHLLGLYVQEMVCKLPQLADAPAGASEYDLLKLKLASHYATFEQSRLQGMSRQDGESFEGFVTRLRLRAAQCGYDMQQRVENILQCAVSRCRDKDLQMKFIRLSPSPAERELAKPSPAAQEYLPPSPAERELKKPSPAAQECLSPGAAPRIFEWGDGFGELDNLT